MQLVLLSAEIGKYLRCDMSYKRKTEDVYYLLTNYGYGWEAETCEETLREIRQREKEYIENTNALTRIIKRREAKEQRDAAPDYSTGEKHRQEK